MILQNLVYLAEVNSKLPENLASSLAKGSISIDGLRHFSQQLSQQSLQHLSQHFLQKFLQHLSQYFLQHFLQQLSQQSPLQISLHFSQHSFPRPVLQHVSKHFLQYFLIHNLQQRSKATSSWEIGLVDFTITNALAADSISTDDENSVSLAFVSIRKRVPLALNSVRFFPWILLLLPSA